MCNQHWHSHYGHSAKANVQQAEDTNISEHQQTRLSPIHLGSLDHVNMQYSNFKSDTTCATPHLHTYSRAYFTKQAKFGVPGRIQTYESNALQAQPLDHSGTETNSFYYETH